MLWSGLADLLVTHMKSAPDMEKMSPNDPERPCPNQMVPVSSPTMLFRLTTLRTFEGSLKESYRVRRSRMTV